MTNNFAQTLQEIKSNGYWHIHAYPNNSSELIKVPLTSLKETLRSTSIQLRGWDYPHVPTHNDEKQALYNKGDAVESWINWEQFKEVCRLHETGQFIHLFGLREDLYRLNRSLGTDHYLKKIDPGSALDALGANYSLTEVYLFLRNLTEKGFYDQGLVVEISLRNTLNRELQVFDPRRAPLFTSYSAMTSEVTLPQRIYQKEDFMSRYLEFALDQTLYLFSQFNWDNPPIEVLKEDQKKLLERRL